MFPLFLHPNGSVIIFKQLNINNPSTWLSFILAIAVFIFSIWIATKKSDEFSSNKSKFNIPGKPFLISYFILRFAFICLYETWFRGYLLNDSILVMGVNWGILFNVIIYVLLHIVNGKEEALICIPFGLALCLLCISQKAVWPAMVIHLAFTIPYELFFIRKVMAWKNPRLV
jgi:membrane protease YdiL (CAAX protease family)